MKRSEIEIGKSYPNGRGRVRKVVDIGPQYKIYDGQETNECLCYEIVKDGSKKNMTAGKHCNMTIASFANWAKEAVLE